METPVWAQFLARSRRLTVPQGRSLYAQGAQHTSSYFIEHGLVRAYYTAASGREITLAFWSDGELIGGPDFFGGTAHIWAAVTAGDSILHAIPGPVLKQLAAEDARVALWVAESLTRKFRWLSLLFQLHGTESVQQRLAKLLAMLSEMYGVSDNGGIVLRHKFNQNDLAALVGASRQWTNKALQDLQSRGLLVLKSRQIVILDLDGLDQIEQ